MSKQKAEKPTIASFKCPECRSDTKLVYRSNNTLYFKCKRGHADHGSRIYPVFGVAASEFEGVN